MIPILYDEGETQFESGGIGYLADCTSCIATEERNGIFELEFSYPCNGPLFNQIRERRIIFATHDDTKIGQPFDIYARSEPIDGIVTFKAHHISYRLSDSVVMPFTATGCASAMKKVGENLISADTFNFYTNVPAYDEYKLTVPTICRDILGGDENSFLTTFGNYEFMFDKFNVYFYTKRGTNKNIEVRYGKNLIDFTHEIDRTDVYNVVVPYWFQEGSEGQPDVLVTLPEQYIQYSSASVDFFDAVPLDLSSDFDEQPTADELRAVATNQLRESFAWIPLETYEVNMAALWQTEEYKDFAPLQRVNLCDSILLYFPQYGMQAVREKVVKTVYNTLLDRYDEITLGELPPTFNGVVQYSLYK